MSEHTPGKWSTCNSKCNCMIISGENYPIAKVECGEWGDTYPAIRIKTNGTLMHGMEAEAYLEMCSYGDIPLETAWANARLIAAAPDLLAVCKKVVDWQLEGRLSETEKELVEEAYAAIKRTLPEEAV